MAGGTDIGGQVSSVELDPIRGTAQIAGPGFNQLLMIPANEMLRLLREDWPNAKMLAEEIYAILNSGVKNGSQNGSVNLSQAAPGQFPLVINTGPDGNGIQISGPGGSGGISIGIGGITFPTGTISPSKPTAPSGGGGIPGQVQSGGPGQGPYSVQIYENGLGKGVTNTVSVTQLQIDANETIPTGTWAMVTKSPDGTFTMQVPVWEV